MPFTCCCNPLPHGLLLIHSWLSLGIVFSVETPSFCLSISDTLSQSFLLLYNTHLEIHISIHHTVVYCITSLYLVWALYRPAEQVSSLTLATISAWLASQMCSIRKNVPCTPCPCRFYSLDWESRIWLRNLESTALSGSPEFPDSSFLPFSGSPYPLLWDSSPRKYQRSNIWIIFNLKPKDPLEIPLRALWGLVDDLKYVHYL